MVTEKRSLSIEAKVTDLATSAFAKMLGGARSFAAGAVPLFKATAVAFGAISAAAIGGFVVFRRYAEELDKIAKVSDKFGVTAESLTAIRNGAELAGVGIDALAAATKNFEKVVAEANDGGTKQREILRSLGLQSEQFAGAQLDLVQVLSQVAGGLEGVDSAAERTRILIDLFGKSGADLAPLLKGGAAGIQQIAAEAKAAGAVFSREELQRVEDFNDAWQSLQQTFRALAERIVVDLSPAIRDVFKTLNEVLRGNSAQIRAEFVELVATLVEGFRLLELAFQSIRLIVNGLKSLSFYAADVSLRLQGLGSAADALEPVLIRQVAYTAELRDEFGKASYTVKTLQDAVEKLRQSGAKGPILEVAPPAAGGDDKKKKSTPTEWEDFIEGVEKARLQWTDFSQTVKDSGSRLVGGTLDALTSSIATGLARTKSWGDVWKAFGASVKDILTQVIAKLLVVRALSGFSSLFSSGGSAPAASSGGGGASNTGGAADVGFQLQSAGGGQRSVVSFPRGGQGPAGTVNINLSFHSIDPRGGAELIRKERATIIQIVAEAMQRSNAFRGTVKEASA